MLCYMLHAMSLNTKMFTFKMSSELLPSVINQSLIHYIKRHFYHTLDVKRVNNTSTRETFLANKINNKMKHSFTVSIL